MTTSDEMLARLEANKAVAIALGWTVWQRPMGTEWFVERPSKPGFIQAMPLPDYVALIERHNAGVSDLAELHEALTRTAHSNKLLRAEVERLTQIIVGKEVAMGLKEAAIAAAQKRVGVLEELAREVAYDDGRRETVSERNAFPFFSKLNQRMCRLRDMARAALGNDDGTVSTEQPTKSSS